MKRKAFTLAEVLITLGIIGVVAVMTIPNLIQKTNDKELASAYLKNHNVLNNAYKEAESIKGFKLYGLEPDRFKEYFEEHLKLSGKSNCTHDVCLVDGSYYDYECSGGKCDYIVVDINGKKRPNQAGKDIYKFKITPNGLISEGEREICSGLDCGNYVLSHHKIFDGLLSGCEEYGSDGRCSQCSDGYKIENGLCSAVNTPNCKDYVGESCTSCKSGYLLTETSCTSMADLHCSATEDGEACSTCSLNYHLDNGICKIGYTENCSLYTDSECSTCETGFYLKNGQCPQVPKYCSGMNDDKTCQIQNSSNLSSGVAKEYNGKFYVYTKVTTNTASYVSMCEQAGLRAMTFKEAQDLAKEINYSANLADTGIELNCSRVNDGGATIYCFNNSLISAGYVAGGSYYYAGTGSGLCIGD